jgi:hypothetical protein
MKTNLVTQINQINLMLPEVDRLDSVPMSYVGGSFPFYIGLNEPIKIKNQYVYINAPKYDNFYRFEKRYNTNTYWQLEELKNDLSLIKRVFKKELKNI